jgi:serine/threonine protein kinase
MMAAGRRPFSGSDIKTVMTKVLSADPEIPDTFSPELRDLITRMLAKSAAARIPLPQIKAHPWFGGYTDWNTSPVNVARLKVCDFDAFDSLVVTEMKALHIDVNRLRADLQDGARSEAAVVYKMLRREHICDMLAEGAQRERALRPAWLPAFGDASRAPATARKPALFMNIPPSTTQPRVKINLAHSIKTLPPPRRLLQRRASLPQESFSKVEESNAA